MPRPATGSWDDRSKRYYAKLGERIEGTTKRRSVMLTHEDGRPIAFGDRGAVASAIRRLTAEREEKERRSGGPLVIEVTNEYITWHEKSGSSPATIQGHKDHLGLFCRFAHNGVKYGARPAASITLADLTRMRKAMEAAGRATGYIKNRYASVLACWNWAARPVEDREVERLIPTNPFAGVARPKRGEIIDKAVPWELSRALLRFVRGMTRPPTRRGGRGPLVRRDWPRTLCPWRDRNRYRLNIMALHMAAITGCRPGEAAELSWDEIDWKLGAAVLRRGKMYSRTKKKRVIFFTRRFLSTLKAIKDSGIADPEYVFKPAGSRKDGPPLARELAVWFRGIRDKAIRAGISVEIDGERVGVPREMTVYWFRHSYATDNTHSDADIEKLAQIMNNSPGEIRKTYRHTSDRILGNEAEQLARSRRGKGK